MDLEIISIGSEVLSGHTINTNAAFLARHLSELGYVVRRHTTVSDEVEEIEKAFLEASERSLLLVATGGLGPTMDDRTKQVADALFEQPILLKNSIGTASGVIYAGKPTVILLPGVPREMETMFLEEVFVWVQKKLPLTSRRFSVGRYLCLLKEVEVNPFLVELQKNHPDVEIGIYPSQGFLYVEFSGFVEKELLHLAELLEKRFFHFCVGKDPVAETLHRELIARKKTLALAESCTGGAISAALTAMPLASSYLLGSLVVYSNSWKERFLQVSHSTLKKPGAVSLKTVEEMIEGLLQETDADFVIAISGIFGPTGATAQKPLGTTYIGIAERGQKLDIGQLKAPSDRKSAIEWGVQTAFGALWRRLVHGVFSFS